MSKQRYIIKFVSYNLKTDLKEEGYKKLQTLIPELLKYPTAKEIPYYADESKFEVCLDELIDIVPSNSYEIIGKVYQSSSNLSNEVHDDILSMKKALYDFGTLIDTFSREKDMLNFNLGKNPVVINVQNDKLLAINELMELKEESYEQVQNYLDDSWMIITTYVERTMSENGDALPTYVMGRHNSKLNAKEL